MHVYSVVRPIKFNGTYSQGSVYRISAEIHGSQTALQDPRTLGQIRGVPLRMVPMTLPALLGAVILNYARSSMIQDGSTWEIQAVVPPQQGTMTMVCLRTVGLSRVTTVDLSLSNWYFSIASFL